MFKSGWLKQYGPYAIAVVGTAIVVAFRFSISGLVGEQAVLIFFGIPVAAAALTGGALPGFLALSLGVASGFWFFRPIYSETITPIGLGSFIATWGIVVVLCEIARRRLEAERQSVRLKQETEERLSEILNRITDGFFTVDHSWKITTANPSALQLVGLTAKEAIGKPIWVAFSEHLRPSVRKLMERSLTTRLPVTIDLPANTEGQWYQFRVFSSPGQDNMPVFIQDVTAQHELERARERVLADERAKRSDAEQKSRSNDDFVAMLSHELRTPMTAILGWTEILSRGKDLSPFLKEGLESIDRASKLQAQLIDDLLDMSRIVTGNLALHKEIIDLREQLLAVIREHSPAAIQNKRILMCEPCDAGILVRADVGRLQQIISNLVANALKFTSEGGRVVLACGREEKFAVITVSDDGQGIEPHVLPVIFNRFRQGHSTVSLRQGGLGLGLAIVRQLVEAHGGTVTAESDGAGKGSKFTIRLPIAQASPVSNGRRPDASHNSLAGLRVLVVEDDEATRRVVERLLSMNGAEVEVVETGQAGLAHLAAFKPNVVVSDLGMPDMDGYALVEEIRQNPDPVIAKVATLALTAFSGQDDRDRAIRAGFDAFLAKPVDTKGLITTILDLARSSKNDSAAPAK